MQAMRDEDVGKPEFLLQFPEQMQDLRCNRNIRGRDGFVRNDDAFSRRSEVVSSGSWIASGSATISSTRMRGLSEAKGS